VIAALRADLALRVVETYRLRARKGRRPFGPRRLPRHKNGAHSES
jgi:hypothetical protein